MKYYLDIETTGLDELHNKIITIQYMELERNTGKPVGPLKILKEWESDEKTILKRFIEDFVPETNGRLSQLASIYNLSINFCGRDVSQTDYNQLIF